MDFWTRFVHILTLQFITEFYVGVINAFSVQECDSRVKKISKFLQFQTLLSDADARSDDKRKEDHTTEEETSELSESLSPSMLNPQEFNIDSKGFVFVLHQTE